jgi:hypothetical protein
MTPTNPVTDSTHVTADDVGEVFDRQALDGLELPSRRPTRKWIAARVTALSTWLLAVLALPELDWKAAVAGLVPIIAEAVVSYVTPNDPAPGGVRPTVD